MINSLVHKLNKSKDYKEVFNSAAGKRVLHDLLTFCNYNKPTYVVGDPYGTHYNEGMRRVALRLVSFLSLDFTQANKIIEESND